MGLSGFSLGYSYDPLGGRNAAAHINDHVAPLWGTATWGAFTWTAPAVTSTVFLHDGDTEIAEYDKLRQPDPPLCARRGDRRAHRHDHPRRGRQLLPHRPPGQRHRHGGHGRQPGGGAYTYDAYGNCFVGGEHPPPATPWHPPTEPYRYTGQRYDTDTGLYYYRARYYHPGLGRFAETDPVGYGPDVNWYSYVGNDPTDKNDPTGNETRVIYCVFPFLFIGIDPCRKYQKPQNPRRIA